jgi:hypothetical protein
MIRHLVQYAALAGMLAAGPEVIAAQTSNPTSQGEDLSRTTRFWLSGGLGPSGFHGTSGVGARASATLSIDRAVAMFRMTGSIEGVDGHTDHAESSVLLGLRLGGKHFYLIPAIGRGTARWSDDLCTAHVTCTPEVAAQFKAKGPVIAYDIGLHASKLFAGVGLNVTGVAGSEKLDLLALLFSVELGAFGR